MLKAGRKTLEWNNAKKKLKVAYERVGITYCELAVELSERGYEIGKHRHTFFLTWAHGDKRNNLVGNELLTLVVLGCVDCHTLIERLPRLEMREIVEAIIAKRTVQPEL